MYIAQWSDLRVFRKTRTIRWRSFDVYFMSRVWRIKGSKRGGLVKQQERPNVRNAVERIEYIVRQHRRNAQSEVEQVKLILATTKRSTKTG